MVSQALCQGQRLCYDKSMFAPCWFSKPSQEPAPFRENPADLTFPEPEAKLCCW